MKFNIHELLAQQENQRCIQRMGVALCSLLQIPIDRYAVATAMGFASNVNNLEAVQRWITEQVGSSAVEVDYLWLKDELAKHINKCVDQASGLCG